MLTNCQELSEGLKCVRGRTQNVHQIQNKTSKFDHIQTRYAVPRWPLHHCGYNTVKKQSCICLGDRKKSIHSPIYKHPLIFTECNLKPGPHKVKNTKMRRWNFLVLEVEFQHWHQQSSCFKEAQLPSLFLIFWQIITIFQITSQMPVVITKTFKRKTTPSEGFCFFKQPTWLPTGLIKAPTWNF